MSEPRPTDARPTEPRLRAFACGTTTHDLGALFRGGPRGRRVFPAWVLLFEGTSGARVLIDTGYRTGRWRTGWQGWVYRRLVPPRVRPALAASAHLAAAGVDPASITHVVLTHLHPDHVGGLVDFPSARVVVSRATAELAGAPRLRDGVLTGLLPRPFPSEGALIVETGSFTDNALPGGPMLRLADPGIDPDLRLVDLPGHAPGHMGVLIAGRVLAAGDAAWSGDLLEHADCLRALPLAITHDPAAMVATARLLGEARETGVRVVFGHDPYVEAELLP